MYLLYKKAGETCLECLNRLKISLREQSDTVPESLTYAGRLDPLASGLLIGLGDEEIAQKDRFLGLEKTYEFEVVFGISTDTFDQLGMVYPSESVIPWRTLNFDKEIPMPKILEIARLDVQSFKEGDKGASIEVASEELQQLVSDSIEMHYPFFSSKPVGGMPLFQYTKNHGIEATNLLLPNIKTSIKEIACIDIGSISTKRLAHESIAYAESVTGEFRQHDIASSWKDWMDTNKDQGFDLPIMKIRLSCSSGFYIRTFAMWLGQQVGTGAIARNINRIRVGEYEVQNARLMQ